MRTLEEVEEGAERLAELYRRAGLDDGGGRYPSLEQWKKILAYPSGKKLYTVSFYGFDREKLMAAVGSDSAARDHEAWEQRTGARQIFSGAVKGCIIGSQGQTVDWNFMEIKEFETTDALIRAATDPYKMEFLKNKQETFTTQQWSLLVGPDEFV